MHFGQSYGVSLFLHSEGRQLQRGHLISIANHKNSFLVHSHFVNSFDDYFKIGYVVYNKKS